MIIFVVINFILGSDVKIFVNDKILESALNGELIEEGYVECQPEVVPNAVLGENVDIFLT